MSWSGGSCVNNVLYLSCIKISFRVAHHVSVNVHLICDKPKSSFPQQLRSMNVTILPALTLDVGL